MPGLGQTQVVRVVRPGFIPVVVTNHTDESNWEEKGVPFLTIPGCRPLPNGRQGWDLTTSTVQSRERINAWPLACSLLPASLLLYCLGPPPCLGNGATHSRLCLLTLINNQNNPPEKAHRPM